MAEKNYFEKATDWINDAESSLVELIASVAPWFAPLIPAYLTFEHAVNSLDIPKFFAYVAAGVIEALGLATLSTTFMIWKHNQRYKAPENRSPFWLALGTFLFYLAIVLVINVVQELPGIDDQTKRISGIVLLILLSIPTTTTLAIRYVHRQTVKRLEDARKKKGKVSKEEESLEKVSRNFPSHWRKLSIADKAVIRNSTEDEIVELAGVTKKTARAWKVQVISDDNGRQREMA